MEKPPTAQNLYKEKSTQIISEAIKSAIFIDEKAWVPYTNKSADSPKEEDLSAKLFSKFKQSEVSLAVHRFSKNDLTDQSKKNYLFNGRDLILLDWRLDGKTGEEYALAMLAEIVAKPHIHFCCLYTSEDDLDSVFHNVLAYFSGKTKEYYDELKLTLDPDEEEIKGILDKIRLISVNRDNKSKGETIKRIFMNHKELVGRIKEATGENATDCALIKAGVAFDNVIKSLEPLQCPELVSFQQRVMVLENTIVVILKKHYDTDPAQLIDRIANHVIDSKRSFSQLLGLEMQNIFDRCGSFIDSNLLEVSKDALLKHRAQLRSEGLNLPFEHFIKDVLFVQASLNVATENLDLLDDTFLDSLYDEAAEVKSEELLAMNTFYNSIQLPTEKRIDFGWVFKHTEKEEFYICVTPKSDCLRPKEKIKNSFHFVKGLPISDKKKALMLGDTAIISFLGNNKVVSWTEPNSEQDINLLKYRPLYAKPLSFTVPNPNYSEDGVVEMICLDENADLKKFNATYVTTIKPNYAQRIANHAFSHPVRVSVDFVKESNPKSTEA
ncbi:MAG: response regulator receiver domain [Cyclobacteriaceae bacterium]